MSEQELRKLRDRVEQLELILGIHESMATKLRLVFGIQPGSAEVLGMLMNRTSVTREAIYSLLYGLRPECDQPVWKSIDIVILKIRRALKAHGVEIETLVNVGYLMRPEHKARVREVVANFGKDEIARTEPADFPPIAIRPVALAC